MNDYYYFLFLSIIIDYEIIQLTFYILILNYLRLHDHIKEQEGSVMMILRAREATRL